MHVRVQGHLDYIFPLKKSRIWEYFFKNPSLSRYSRQKLFAILRNYVNGLCMWIKYSIAFLKYLTSFFHPFAGLRKLKDTFILLFKTIILLVDYE